jgi:hypothetical protein
MARPFTPEDYEHLYGQESLADVDLKTQDEEDEAAEVSLPAHSVVLLGQSEYCMIKASDTWCAPNSATCLEQETADMLETWHACSQPAKTELD